MITVAYIYMGDDGIVRCRMEGVVYHGGCKIFIQDIPNIHCVHL